MRAPAKIGLVLAGYVAAIGVAWVAVNAYIALTPSVDRHGAAGMTAFGDSLLFLAVFGVVAVPATIAGLYFLRPIAIAWRVLSAAAVASAATIVAAAGLYLAGRDAAPASVLSSWAAFALRILIAPLVTLALFLCGLLAPGRTARVFLWSAAAIEVVAFGGLLLTWLA
jgi:hypothetical protein